VAGDLLIHCFLSDRIKLVVFFLLVLALAELFLRDWCSDSLCVVVASACGCPHWLLLLHYNFLVTAACCLCVCPLSAAYVFFALVAGCCVFAYLLSLALAFACEL